MADENVVRRVSFDEYATRSDVLDDPNGTHAILPWGVLEEVIGALEEGQVVVSDNSNAGEVALRMRRALEEVGGKNG